MTIVKGKLIGPADPSRVEVTAELVDVTGARTVGYVASAEGEVVRPVRITPESDGTWSADLLPNAGIESVAGDTLWAVMEGRALDGTPVVTHIVVPDTGGPYWLGDLRADLSSTLSGSGTVVYVPGPAGPTGPEGPAGSAGATGPAGAEGAPGPEGPAGPKGDQGETGPAGPQGATGVTGPEGPAGPPGADGAPGATGPKGDQGATGPQPPLGAAGDGPTVALRSDDPTTTNARTPLPHASTHAAAGSDPLTPGMVGADPAGAASNAQSAAISAAAADAATKVTAHTGATDPHGDRAYSDGVTGPIASRVTAVETGFTTVNTYITDAQNRVLALENGVLYKTGGTIGGSLAVTGNALGMDTPAAHGVAAWCYDPALAVNSTQLTAGTLYLVRVNVAANVNVTKVYWWVANTGSSAVAGQNLVGLYDAGGTLLASANVDAAFASATLKTTTIASTALSAGQFYWVALLFNASVTPTLTRGSGWTGVDAAANLGLTAATYRFAKNGTGRTSLPSSITPGSNVGSDIAGPWVAVGS
ncbi:hypothetical protein ACH4TX_41945 [Streptomyces sp. NPDC021098]|uniref:hypothetical protein n=1 Tax=unclassified Streptomyces TaxID=2593676 RepID=UPI0037A266B1